MRPDGLASFCRRVAQGPPLAAIRLPCAKSPEITVEFHHMIQANSKGCYHLPTGNSGDRVAPTRVLRHNTRPGEESISLRAWSLAELYPPPGCASPLVSAFTHRRTGHDLT